MQSFILKKYQACIEQQYQTKPDKVTSPKVFVWWIQKTKNKIIYSKSVEMDKVQHCKLRIFTQKSLIDV